MAGLPPVRPLPSSLVVVPEETAAMAVRLAGLPRVGTLSRPS
ncbi:hypothetical protein [Nonomuraea sp. CA-141351]